MPRFLLGAAGVAALMITGCAVQPAMDPSANFHVLASGTHSGVRKQQFVVIRDAAGYATWWRRASASRSSQTPPPTVDFSRQMVIGLFIGARRTGGYRVEVSGVSRDGDTATVHVREQAPATNCRTTQVLTQPFTMISTDKARDVRFDTQRVEKPC